LKKTGERVNKIIVCSQDKEMFSSCQPGGTRKRKISSMPRPYSQTLSQKQETWPNKKYITILYQGFQTP
jgi:hypothetical protein